MKEGFSQKHVSFFALITGMVFSVMFFALYSGVLNGRCYRIEKVPDANQPSGFSHYPMVYESVFEGGYWKDWQYIYDCDSSNALGWTVRSGQYFKSGFNTEKEAIKVIERYKRYMIFIEIEEQKQKEIEDNTEYVKVR